jgi:hypothetical protein
MMRRILISASALFLFAGSANAKKYLNDYLEFEIPDYWHCEEEQKGHVCSPINPSLRNETAIIMSSKMKGATDSIKDYNNKLGKPIESADIKGKKYKSKVQYVKVDTMNGNIWVDSQHESSEVPGFITRYMATINSELAVAITFSAHKGIFSAYSADFISMIKSLKVRKHINTETPATGKTFNPAAGTAAYGNIEVAGGKKKEAKEQSQVVVDMPVEEQKSKTIYYILAGAVALLAAFVIIRRRRS